MPKYRELIGPDYFASQFGQIAAKAMTQHMDWQYVPRDRYDDANPYHEPCSVWHCDRVGDRRRNSQSPGYCFGHFHA